MPLPSTMTPIATITGSGAITFSSIPQTYTDLMLVIDNATASTGVNNTLRVNGDSGSNYSTTQVYSAGSGAGTLRISNATNSWAGIGGADSITTIHFINYSVSGIGYKNWMSRGSGPTNYVTMDISSWKNTAAINSIYIDTGGTTGTTFTLYGIKAA